MIRDDRARRTQAGLWILFRRWEYWLGLLCLIAFFIAALSIDSTSHPVVAALLIIMGCACAIFGMKRAIAKLGNDWEKRVRQSQRGLEILFSRWEYWLDFFCLVALVVAVNVMGHHFIGLLLTILGVVCIILWKKLALSKRRK